MDTNKTISELHEEILDFLGTFSPHFSKPKLKFLTDMIFGILGSGDVKLSSIARALDERIGIKDSLKRLSRNLNNTSYGQIRDILIELSKKYITRDTLIILDPTDIQKTYAKRMQYLCTTRDGSTGDIGKGYYGCMAIASNIDSRRFIPLDFSLWSSEAPDYKSENDQIAQVIEKISSNVGQKGIYVYDRGGDSLNLYNLFIGHNLNFVVRMVGNRNVLYNKRVILSKELAESIPTRYYQEYQFESSNEKLLLEYGSAQVRLPDIPNVPLTMMVVKGFTENSMMMLLTNLPITTSRKDLDKVLHIYMNRWMVEDAIRLLKQRYRIEDIRVLNYIGIRNMGAILLSVLYFLAARLGKGKHKEKLVHKIIEYSKRIYEVSRFFYYALAEGSQRVLQKFIRKTRTKITQYEPPKSTYTQLDFFEALFNSE